MGNAILVDSEFETVCSEYEQKTQEIEAELQSYIEKIKAIVSEKELEGQTAEALQGFSELTEQTIKDRLERIGTRYKTIVSSFVENTETSDEVAL